MAMKQKEKKKNKKKWHDMWEEDYQETKLLAHAMLHVTLIFFNVKKISNHY